MTDKEEDVNQVLLIGYGPWTCVLEMAQDVDEVRDLGSWILIRTCDQARIMDKDRGREPAHGPWVWLRVSMDCSRHGSWMQIACCGSWSSIRIWLRILTMVTDQEVTVYADQDMDHGCGSWV